MASPSEFDIIQRYFSFSQDNTFPSASVSSSAQSIDSESQAIVAIGDDAAVLPVSENPLVIATDTLIEGVHFPYGFAAEAVASRAMGVNLSDFAAMGAKPRWLTMALSLPNADAEWLEKFSRQFEQQCKQYQVQLIGGDTTKGPLSISLTVLGETDSGQSQLSDSVRSQLAAIRPNLLDDKAICLRRNGAKAGDDIWLSGSLGKGAAALALISADDIDLHCSEADKTQLINSFNAPQPRLTLGAALLGLANSAIDISDGLMADAKHIADQSQVKIIIDGEALPINAALKNYSNQAQLQEWVLAGGDEYELLFTVPAAYRSVVQSIVEWLAVDCTNIGSVEAGRGVTLVGEAWQANNKSGYTHF